MDDRRQHYHDESADGGGGEPTRLNRFRDYRGGCLRDRRQCDGRPHPFLMGVRFFALQLPGANRPSDIYVLTLTFVIIRKQLSNKNNA